MKAHTEFFMRRLLLATCMLLFIAVSAGRAYAAHTDHNSEFLFADSFSTGAGIPLAHGGMEESGGGDSKSPGRHFISWVGHFHPAMTVFPIAMILSAALAELLLIATRAPWLVGASRWCVIVGGVGGAVTAPLGWAFALGHAESRLLEIHRWLGTAAGAGAVALLILSEVAHRRGGGARVAYRTLLFLAVPLVGATGFFGGAMVYGTDEYNWNQPHDEATDQPAPGSVGATAATRSSSAGGVTQIVMTEDDTFKPEQITIPAGTVIRWKNASKGTHTVTDDPKVASTPKDVSSPAGAKAFNSGRIRPGQTFEQRFTIPGTYKYICEPHEEMDMKGQIVVSPGNGSPGAPTRPVE